MPTRKDHRRPLTNASFAAKVDADVRRVGQIPTLPRIGKERVSAAATGTSEGEPDRCINCLELSRLRLKYPRERGGNATALDVEPSELGLSPRARGNRIATYCSASTSLSVRDNHLGRFMADGVGVDCGIWFQSLVKQESGFSIGARSPVGAFGLTQVMPDTAKDLGIYPAYYDDPMLQLDGGARYFLTQLNTFGSVPLALAAYNAGPGNVTKYGGIPPFKETQGYVARITGFFNAYAGKITGVDQVGTFDPRDMAIAEASNTADAGLHYGMHASIEIEASLKRLRSIIERIPTTKSTKEALDLNSYARAEAVRIGLMVERVKAARVKVDQARYALWLQAYAIDATFIKVKAGSE